MEHVGVNAPGTETRTTFFPANKSSVEIAPGPASVITPKTPDGIFWPAEIVIKITPVEVLRFRA
jgi:hypothetical protein